ncbi:MAG: 50S ribosomal protein L28 [Thermaerobacter sp.]|nr:50S ribosomal protein L28 [Thermaerobacter sp.]
MARRCDICGKGTGNGHLVAHCNIKTNRRWHPNLQEVRAMVDGRVRRLHVCTRCLRSGRVQRAV